MLLLFFPARHVPVLYGVLSFPMAVLMWLTPLLFSAMLNGPDLTEADFSVVNSVLAILSGLTSAFIIAIYFLGRKKLGFSAIDPWIVRTNFSLQRMQVQSPDERAMAVSGWMNSKDKFWQLNSHE